MASVTTTPSVQREHHALRPAAVSAVRFSALSRRCTARVPLSIKTSTPYQKTPSNRRLFSQASTLPPQKSPHESEENYTKELLGNTWRVYKVTPLYNFSQKPSQLRTYSRLLSTHIAGEAAEGVFVDLEESRANHVQLTLFKGLHTAADSEKQAVKVCVKQGNKGKDKTILTMILCCVHTVQEDMGVRAPFTALPLMLVRGPVTLGHSIMMWIEKNFDCGVSPLCFSADSLAWMVAMWAGLGVSEGKKTIQMKYKVPQSVLGLDHITMCIHPDDCKKLWDSIHNDSCLQYSQEEVTSFIQSLELHFFHHFKIQISSMELTQIATVIAMASKDGKLKIFRPKFVLDVLGHLTELAFEKTLI